MVYIYLLQNAKRKYYTGITKLDPKIRLKRHNNGDVYSTKSGRPWELLYTETFANNLEARAREKQIKSWKGGNAFKKFLSKAAGSANGRQVASEAINLGSSPSPAALERNVDKFGGVK